MFDRIILSIRQQVEKGSKIIWDIFEILMIYCIDKMVVSIWVFLVAMCYGVSYEKAGDLYLHW